MSPGHVRSQAACVVQLTEHDPVHVTWQVEPPPHDTLPLGPTVTVQVEPPVQSMLQDSPQVPLHVLLFAQSSEQLPSPQLLSVN